MSNCEHFRYFPIREFLNKAACHFIVCLLGRRRSGGLQPGFRRLRPHQGQVANQSELDVITLIINRLGNSRTGRTSLGGGGISRQWRHPLAEECGFSNRRDWVRAKWILCGGCPARVFGGAPLSFGSRKASNESRNHSRAFRPRTRGWLAPGFFI